MNPTTFLRSTTMAFLFQVPLPAQEADIIDTAAGTGFTTLVAAVDAAGLTEALRGEGPFTIFAPTDEAFASLPEGTVEALLRPENRDRLTRILQYHVVPDRLTAARALTSGQTATLAGENLELRIADSRLRVGSAAVVANDIRTSNGIVHVIDSVLLPPEAEASEPANDRASKAEELLVLAIERGVPLFNDGQTNACSAVYEIAIRSVLELAAEDLPEQARSSLEGGLRSAAEAGGAAARAWQLRYGMDGALRIFRHRTTVPGTDSRENRSSGRLTDRPERRDQTVFAFDGTDTARWFVLNDDVMGGVSSSRVSLSDRSSLVFEGRLSLENNGGFASTRSTENDLGLGGVEAFALRVLGDGRTYRFGVRTDTSWNAGSWRADFETVEGEWTEIVIPVSALRYTFRGRQIDRGVVDPQRIRGISLLIGDKNDREPFRLEVDWIRAVHSDDTSSASN